MARLGVHTMVLVVCAFAMVMVVVGATDIEHDGSPGVTSPTKTTQIFVPSPRFPCFRQPTITSVRSCMYAHAQCKRVFLGLYIKPNVLLRSAPPHQCRCAPATLSMQNDIFVNQCKTRNRPLPAALALAHCHWLCYQTRSPRLRMRVISCNEHARRRGS